MPAITFGIPTLARFFNDNQEAERIVLEWHVRPDKPTREQIVATAFHQTKYNTRTRTKVIKER